MQAPGGVDGPLVGAERPDDDGWGPVEVIDELCAAVLGPPFACMPGGGDAVVRAVGVLERCR